MPDHPLQKTFYNKIVIPVFKLKTDFLQLFFLNEYRTLAGTSSKRILTLFVIFLITLLALAFSIGSIDHLKNRMSNPYTNWVDMPVLHRYEASIPNVKTHFDIQANKDLFHLKNITDYVKFNPQFYHNKTNESFYAPGISVDPNGDLVKKILEKGNGNVISGMTLQSSDIGLKEDQLSGVIVTKKMLKRLGYLDIESQRKLPIVVDSFRLYVDIIAVVKELPSLSDFACTPLLYNWLSESHTKTYCLEENGNTNSLFFISPIEDKNLINEQLSQELKNYQIELIKQEPFVINTLYPSFKYELIFDSFYSNEELLKIFNLAKPFLVDPSQKTFWHPKWSCSTDAIFHSIKNPYYLAFNFKELEKIKAFKDHMQKEFNIEISMDQVEAKENFAVVSRLTLTLSLILFVFGITSIVFFVNSLLRNHLTKIKSNLGTFKAFGLNNNLLITNYRNIILIFLLIASSIAYFIANLFVGVEEYLTVDSILNLNNKWVLIAILTLFGTSYFLIEKTIKKILIHTPGNLIYNRV